MSQSEDNDQFCQILNSLEISKRKMSVSIHQSKLLEESKKQQSRKFTMELPKNLEASQSQKERIITNHLLKDIVPLDKQCDENLKTPKVPQTNCIKPIKRGILLLGNKSHPHLPFYLKTLEALDFSELQQSNELLIQNALCAGKYVNDYGLFCVLKEALNKKNIKTIIKQDCLLDEDGNFSGIPQNTKNLKKSIGLQDLHYCCGLISLLKFRINSRFNISNYLFWSKDLEKIEQIIKDSLTGSNKQILFIKMDEISLEFTIPEMDDNESHHFIMKLKQATLDVQILPLISHFTFRMSDLNPWMNKEINKEWKLFSLQSEQQQCIGYHEMNSPVLFNEIPSPKTITVKLYGEIHQYQIALQMSDKQVIGILLRDKA